MIAMIQRKAQFGSMNHGTKTLGDNIINDMFSKPPAFLEALDDAGYVVPGDPDNSKIMHLMGFTGPMFHVFTDDEQALWRRYILSLAPGAPGGGGRDRRAARAARAGRARPGHGQGDLRPAPAAERRPPAPGTPSACAAPIPTPATT